MVELPQPQLKGYFDQLSVTSNYIRMYFGSTPLAHGTCFFVMTADGPVLVTNRHNFTGRNNITGEPLHRECGIAENQQYRHAAGANWAAWLAENQQRRAAWQAEVRQYRDEARSAHETYQREILRIREAHAKPAAGASPRPGEQQ